MFERFEVRFLTRNHELMTERSQGFFKRAWARFKKVHAQKTRESISRNSLAIFSLFSEFLMENIQNNVFVKLI